MIKLCDRISTKLLAQRDALQYFIANLNKGQLLEKQDYTKAIRLIKSISLLVWLYEFYRSELERLSRRFNVEEIEIEIKKLNLNLATILEVWQQLIQGCRDVNLLIALFKTHERLTELAEILDRRIAELVTSNNVDPYLFDDIIKLAKLSNHTHAWVACDSKKMELLAGYEFVEGLFSTYKVAPPVRELLNEFRVSLPGTEYSDKIYQQLAQWPEDSWQRLSFQELWYWFDMFIYGSEKIVHIHTILRKAIKKKINKTNSLVYLLQCRSSIAQDSDLGAPIRQLIEWYIADVVEKADAWNLVDGLLIVLQEDDDPCHRLKDKIGRKLTTIVRSETTTDERVVDFLRAIYELGYFPDKQISLCLAIRAADLFKEMATEI